VRREVATALGRSKQPQAVDFLGALLRDRSDSVRAAAVRALVSQPGEGTVAYVVHAYRDGGPLTRRAVSEATADVFRRSVPAEAGEWRAGIETRRKDSRPQVQAEALAELGRDGSPVVIAELTSRLVDPHP